MEFKSLGLSAYLVETWTVVLDIYKFKELAILVSISI